MLLSEFDCKIAQKECRKKLVLLLKLKKRKKLKKNSKKVLTNGKGCSIIDRLSHRGHLIIEN